MTSAAKGTPSIAFRRFPFMFSLLLHCVPATRPSPAQAGINADLRLILYDNFIILYDNFSIVCLCPLVKYFSCVLSMFV